MRKLDLTKLTFSDAPMPIEEALKNIEPLEIPDEVLNGSKKMLVTDAFKTNDKIGVTIKYV